MSTDGYCKHRNEARGPAFYSSFGRQNYLRNLHVIAENGIKIKGTWCELLSEEVETEKSGKR